MTQPLEIRLLGPFEVVAGGRPEPVSGSKRAALIAVLALRHGRVVAVDALIDALWGTELPAAPRNALQHHVTRLRAALGHESIVATAEGYALVDACVDALEFEELLRHARAVLRQGAARVAADTIARGLALWRGPPLHGLPDTPWVTGEARRLEALRFDALEEEFEAALALGSQAGLVPRIRRALEESPFRERLWRQLILALYRGGRAADALEAFQEARRVLAEELGLEPGPDLQRLQAAILAHDPGIAPPPVQPQRRGNLPAPVTSFVDRKQELARVLELLREQRLVTITGPPGVGKSRLALEAARSLEKEVADGIWLVDLGRAHGPADVARLVADVVGADGGGRIELVTARLRDASAILVLDGCGRVVEDAARVASRVLAECPGVRVLATSRQVLHVAGEAQLNLVPLALPDRDAADGSGSVAVDLFVERARAVRSDFELTPEAKSFVGEICRRLDGLPLAIELVAARVNALGLSEILSSLERRFAEPPGSGRGDGADPALETLVAWSYDLLHADEKTLLHQLALHRGGASLGALVAIAAEHGLDEAIVAQLVGALVDKSVVTVSFADGVARYDLLDTVRQYALERLAQTDRFAAARKAHAEYFVSLAEASRTELRGPDWLASLKRLQLENDNLWAALAYVGDAPDPTMAVRLAAPLGWYFALAERISEGRRFLETALASAPDGAPIHLRIELLAHLCHLAAEETDLDTALEAADQGLALAAGDVAPYEGALVSVALSVALCHAGDYERALELAEEARAVFDGLGDHWGAAAAALRAAIAAAGAGDVARASALNAEVVRQCEPIAYDAFGVPAALLQGWIAEHQEDADAAAAYRHARELSERAGFEDHVSFALAALGSIASAQGDLRQAEALCRRALAVAEAASASWTAAHARVQLARVLEARDDVDAAATLYRTVVEESVAPRPHRARESLFVTLAGNPAEAAALGLETAAVGAANARVP